MRGALSQNKLRTTAPTIILILAQSSYSNVYNSLLFVFTHIFTFKTV